MMCVIAAMTEIGGMTEIETDIEDTEADHRENRKAGVTGTETGIKDEVMRKTREAAVEEGTTEIMEGRGEEMMTGVVLLAETEVSTRSTSELAA